MPFTPNSLCNVDNVNIEKFPSIDEAFKIDQDAQLTLGDLHGNTLKLLYTLIKHDVVRNISAEDYAVFVGLYKINTAELTKENIQWFNKFIDNIDVNPLGTLRLIGDDLADRGANDYFTLCLLAKLFNKTTVEILISNHTLEFVEAYERGTDYLSVRLAAPQASSMHHLNQMIAIDLVNRIEIDNKFATQYLPNLKLLSYTIDEATPEISIYTHAPAAIESIQAVAQKMEVAYKDNTLVELAQTIDDINRAFTENYVNTKKVHELFADINRMSDPSNADPIALPFLHIIWNRLRNINRPENYKGYNVKFVHGHDLVNVATNWICNLDNMLGKGFNVEGLYKVLFNHEKPLHALAAEAIARLSIVPVPSERFDKIVLRMLKTTLWAPSQHPVIAGALGAMVVAGAVYLMAFSLTAIIASSLLSAIIVSGLISIRNSVAQNASQQFNSGTIAAQTLQDQADYRQGIDAASGWGPYAIAITFNVKNYPAFVAGLDSALKAQPTAEQARLRPQV